MKIDINTEEKFITVEGATLKELFDFIQKIEGWEEYKIVPTYCSNLPNVQTYPILYPITYKVFLGN